MKHTTVFINKNTDLPPQDGDVATEFKQSQHITGPMLFHYTGVLGHNSNVSKNIIKMVLWGENWA